MKLELKHLATYLPYSLKLIVSSVDGSDYELLTGLISQNGQSIAQISNTDYYLDDVEENDFSIAPILRPLSDLTKEIEINGEKFVPLDWFDKNYAPLECSHKEMQKHFMKDTLKTMPYLVIEKLIEWHFDVFGLIENNLAININTLNK